MKVDANRSAINTLDEQTRERFDRLERKVDDGFTRVRGQLDGTAASLEDLAGLLDALIDQQGGGNPGNTPR